MRILSFIVAIVFSACQSKDIVQNNNNAMVDWRDHWEDPKEKDSILLMEWVHPRVKQCLMDTKIVVLTGLFLSDTSRFNTLRNLGDINGDLINDSIMVVPELFVTPDSSYENGTSIIFSDPSIPRIRVDQECLNVDFVFATADINEDKHMELGKYYTSCVSRFKRIDLLSLKDNQWLFSGAVTFDTWFEDPPKEQRIRKTDKGQFEMREITDSAGVKIDRWIKFKLQ
jgi:hypothetical protein